MVKRLTIAMAMLATASAPVAADEVVPVSESAFAELLIGCWSSKSGDVCFYADGTVGSAVLYATADGTYSGGSGGGTWSFENEKLALRSETDFWALPLPTMDCDAAILPNVSLQLTGCLDAGLQETPIAIQLKSVDATMADIRGGRQ
jgi:hypothetical protein